ncbi:unnamed protein product [Sphenostylis stenocarpa]|uniref:Uncharacterized protein n=1 Tax=Sphenostylis stenocarpa TaxID=92480 RepID=A0AA86SZL6_9FABA|nr:unnamed protein product [Sphenostylis stenocarpa]
MTLIKHQHVHQSFIKDAFSPYMNNKYTHNSWFFRKGKISFSKVQRKVSTGCVSRSVKAVMKKNSTMSSNSKSKSRNVKVIVTVKGSGGGLLTHLVKDGVHGIEELVGKTLVLELVSNELDSSKF